MLGYDKLDRLTEVKGPNGTVAYLYDDAGRRAYMSLPGQEALAYEYDDADRLRGLSRPGEAVSLDYDAASRLTGLTLPNGIEQLYGYDEAGQPTSITYKDGESTSATWSTPTTPTGAPRRSGAATLAWLYPKRWNPPNTTRPIS